MQLCQIMDGLQLFNQEAILLLVKFIPSKLHSSLVWYFLDLRFINSSFAMLKCLPQIPKLVCYCDQLLPSFTTSYILVFSLISALYIVFIMLNITFYCDRLFSNPAHMSRTRWVKMPYEPFYCWICVNTFFNSYFFLVPKKFVQQSLLTISVKSLLKLSVSSLSTTS